MIGGPALETSLLFVVVWWETGTEAASYCVNGNFLWEITLAFSFVGEGHVSIHSQFEQLIF